MSLNLITINATDTSIPFLGFAVDSVGFDLVNEIAAIPSAEAILFESSMIIVAETALGNAVIFELERRYGAKLPEIHKLPLTKKIIEAAKKTTMFSSDFEKDYLKYKSMFEEFAFEATLLVNELRFVKNSEGHDGLIILESFLSVPFSLAYAKESLPPDFETEGEADDGTNGDSAISFRFLS